MVEALLQIANLRAGYGSSIVLDGISLDVEAQGSLAVLGRNGVGKSTLLLTIMGYTRVSRGRILWRGADITYEPPHRRARAGIGWVAQEREIFATLTVEENLTVAARDGHWSLPRVYELFPRLAERRRNAGNQLSGGEQQMLAIARALMTNPALLLLDEPFEGLAPAVILELFSVFDQLREHISILIVEHNLDLVLALADRVFALERGTVFHEGPAAPLLNDLSYRKKILWL